MRTKSLQIFGVSLALWDVACGASAPESKAPGGSASAGESATGGAGAGGGSVASSGSVDCNATMPTGGNTYSGAGVDGTADGLNYGIWANGSGGKITVFPNAHAFGASWDNGGDFLAHLGLDFNGSKSYTAYGTIAAQFVESKTGNDGGYSFIGVYGWTHSPCVEWYINEDTFSGPQKSGVTATIDGGTYYLSTNSTTGSGGNACEHGHTGPWTQIWSYRQTPRQCGTVTVSDHFAAWTKQGWGLGNLAYVHINVEVGGGTGSIQLPVANITTRNK